MRFEPQQLPAERAIDWIRQGAALTMRKPLQFLVLTLAPTAFLAATGAWGNVLLAAVFPLLVGAGVMVASAADDSVSSIERVMQVDRAAWLRLVAAGLVIFLFQVAAFLAVYALLTPDLADQAQVPATPPPPPLATVAYRFCDVFALLHFSWHVPTLLLVTGLPLRYAGLQTHLATVLNPITIFLGLAISVVDNLLGPLLALVIIPLFPVVVCTMYVSFREIWLGRLENRRAARKQKPAVATQST